MVMNTSEKATQNGADLPFLKSTHPSRIERADERTADLISLRVINHALQGFARACKSRISRPFSSPWLALRCTVLRSRWYQSGIKGLPRMHRGRCPTSDLSMLSLFPECAGTPH